MDSRARVAQSSSLTALCRSAADAFARLCTHSAHLLSLHDHLAQELDELSILAAALKSSASVSATASSPSGEYGLQNVFHRRWKRFARGLLEQWQMMNYVSAVFIGTIATMLQDPLVSGDALGRALAAASFLCALSSLCNGVMLYIHLTKIKKADHALVWVTNFQMLTSGKWMKPLTTLTAPAIWLLWAVVFFVMALSISYVWQPPNIASQLLPRIAVACALVFCVVQTLMVVWTLRKLKPGLSPQSGVQARGTDTLDV